MAPARPTSNTSPRSWRAVGTVVVLTEYLTVDQVAQKLRVPAAVVRGMIADGTLVAEGWPFRIHPGQLARAVEHRRMSATKAPPERGQEDGR